MTTILKNAPATELWLDLVKEGEERAQTRLAEDTESYLVFTLMRHFKDAPLANRVMALELLEALNMEGRMRQEQLRDVGDRCLLIAGFYPELAKKRCVTLQYFVELGQNAYHELAAQLRDTFSHLYAHLSQAFATLVRTLLEIRKLSGEWAGPDPMSRYSLATIDATYAQSAFPNKIVIPHKKSL